MEGRPDVDGPSADLYTAFHYLTPDFNGNLTFADMRAVLDAFGVTELSEQLEAMDLFRQMHREHRPPKVEEDG